MKDVALQHLTFGSTVWFEHHGHINMNSDLISIGNAQEKLVNRVGMKPELSNTFY